MTGEAGFRGVSRADPWEEVTVRPDPKNKEATTGWREKLGVEPFRQSEQAEGVGGGREPGTFPESQCGWRVVVPSGWEGEAWGSGRNLAPLVSAGHGKEAGLSWKSGGKPLRSSATEVSAPDEVARQPHTGRPQPKPQKCSEAVSCSVPPGFE